MSPDPTGRKVIPSWEMNCLDDEVESSTILVLGPMADEHKGNPCWFPVRGCVDDSHTIETRSSSRRSSAPSQSLDVKTNLMFQAANMKHKSRLASRRQTCITFGWMQYARRWATWTISEKKSKNKSHQRDSTILKGVYVYKTSRVRLYQHWTS